MRHRPRVAAARARRQAHRAGMEPAVTDAGADSVVLAVDSLEVRRGDRATEEAEQFAAVHTRGRRHHVPPSYFSWQLLCLFGMEPSLPFTRKKGRVALLASSDACDKLARRANISDFQK